MKITFYKTVALLVSLVALVSSCKEDPIPEEYKRGGNSLALADDGNLIMAGYNSTTSKGYDATLILANQANGDTIWMRSFGDTYSDSFYHVQKAHGGGFIATGFSNRGASASPAMFVVITDANGNNVKTARYSGSYYSQGFNVLPLANADSGYIIAGYIQNSANTDRDIYLVKISNAGEAQWEKRIGSKSRVEYDSVNEAAYSIISAPDGGYFITGSLNGYSSCCGKIFLMKVSSTGDSLWTKKFNYGIGYSIIAAKNGGVVISGTFQEGISQDIFLIKTDTAGNLLWKKTYGGTGYEYGASMVETSDGGFAITGITDMKGSQDVYLIRTSSTGDLQWSNTYGGSNVDQGFGLVAMPDNGFCISGLSNTDGSFFFLNRTTSEGAQSWVKKIQ